MSNIVRIQPLQYVHIQDLNTNVTVLNIGPNSLILQDNHVLVKGPSPYVVIPPGHYCIIENPVKEPCEPGKLCHLQHGHREVKLHKEPFPLYPGEVLVGATDRDYRKGIRALPVVEPNKAIRLTATMDHEVDGVMRKAGEMWQLEGPCTYRPTPYAEVISTVHAKVIRYGEALRLKAKQDLVDRDGKKHVTGEQWLVRELGSYLPGVYEQLVGIVAAHTLTQNKALHMRALENCVDALGKKRTVGQEWLVTMEDSESYIPEVSEEVVQEVKKTVLSRGQYCIVLDPVDDEGCNQLGQKILRRGVATFFLHPGETLENGIQASYVLGADESLVLSAVNEFVDDFGEEECERSPGDRWMILGPLEYIPPIEVYVNSSRKAVPLNKNEGIYVRDTKTGNVRAVMGPQSYLLKAYEEYWEKDLPDDVEQILTQGGGTGSEDIRKMAYFESSIDAAYLQNRDKTHVVVYRCPGNTAVQVYDYLKKKPRVIFGPDLVVLGPHENFNVLNLSAGKPKRANALKTICLMLGPDFITDVLEVETSDHARLRIKVAMNNLFEIDKNDPESARKAFSTPDFIGFVCKNIASRVRGSVAQIPFDEFHRFSATLIRRAVFGVDEKGKVRSRLKFDANNLVITNIDIQSIEPVDVNMRESLSKSVQMAIEIATKSIERYAQHEANRTEQMAKGQLERQKLTNEKEVEEARRKLFELRAITAAVESSGQTKAEAQAQAEKLLIEGENDIAIAKLKAEAAEVELNAELEAEKMQRLAEQAFKRQMDELEIQKAKQLAGVEVGRFAQMVHAIGPKTITRIANSGPESQMAMLRHLNVESVLFTDGVTPIHLFQGGQQHGFVHTGTKS